MTPGRPASGRQARTFSRQRVGTAPRPWQAPRGSGDAAVCIGITATGGRLHDPLLQVSAWSRWKKLFCRAVSTQPSLERGIPGLGATELDARAVLQKRTPRERGPSVPFSTGMPTNRCWTWVAFVRREKLEAYSALRRTFMLRHVSGFRRLSSLATAVIRLGGRVARPLFAHLAGLLQAASARPLPAPGLSHTAPLAPG